MRQKLQNKEKGFTIIEVLIVLAIAGLIMLVVFLAVPALQRNQRNNQRNSEASRIVTAVQECIANRNGQTGSCNTAAALGSPATQELTGLSFGATGAAPSTTNARVVYSTTCNADGSGTQAGTATARQFTVSYQLEPNVTRCLGS